MTAHSPISAVGDVVRRFGNPNIFLRGAKNPLGETYARVGIPPLNPNGRETFTYFCVGLCMTRLCESGARWYIEKHGGALVSTHRWKRRRHVEDGSLAS